MQRMQHDEPFHISSGGGGGGSISGSSTSTSSCWHASPRSTAAVVVVVEYGDHNGCFCCISFACLDYVIIMWMVEPIRVRVLVGYSTVVPSWFQVLLYDTYERGMEARGERILSVWLDLPFQTTNDCCLCVYMPHHTGGICLVPLLVVCSRSMNVAPVTDFVA